jgi:type IV secretion system protein TrbJ
MSNYNYMKRAMLVAGLAVGFGIAKPASAEIVFDPVTESFTGVIMLKMKDVDKTTKKMAQTLDHMSGTLDDVDGHAGNIDVTNNNISNQTDIMTDNSSHNTKIIGTIDKSTNYYGSDDGIIPLQGVLQGASVASYEAQSSAAKDYKDTIGSDANLSNVGVDASASRKNANNALVDALSKGQGAIQQESEQIATLTDEGVASAQDGTNTALGYANALAGAQAQQLMEMRHLMLAQANAQVAEQQAAQDQDARNVASSLSLRRNLPVASSHAADTSGDQSSDEQQ